MINIPLRSISKQSRRFQKNNSLYLSYTNVIGDNSLLWSDIWYNFKSSKITWSTPSKLSTSDVFTVDETTN